MWFISIILILVSWRSDSDFFVGISDTIKTLHESCLNFTPTSTLAPYYSAVVCGEELAKNISTLDTFKKLGVYYFLVISGTHLSYVSAILEHLLRIKRNSFLLLIALGFFSLITGFQPPVVRSFFALLIDAIQKKLKLFWTPSEVAFLSLCLCLALNPSWKQSFSMVLSHAAFMAILLTVNLSFFARLIWIYILIFPFLLPLAAPNVFAIFSHAILSLFIEGVLFPLSFLSYFTKWFVPIGDFGWKLLITTMTTLSPYFTPFEVVPVSKNILWALLLIFSFYGIYKEKKWNS